MEQTAFHVDRVKSRDEWKEAINIIVEAWKSERFSWDSPTFKFPERVITPSRSKIRTSGVDGGDVDRLVRDRRFARPRTVSFSIMQPLEVMASKWLAIARRS